MNGEGVKGAGVKSEEGRVKGEGAKGEEVRVKEECVKGEAVKGQVPTLHAFTHSPFTAGKDGGAI